MSVCDIRLDPANKYSNAFYMALKEKGISCAALDAGYRIINYDGKYCSNDGSGSCLRGAGDGVVESTEVIEYVMNRYETFRGLIEGVLQRPLPWVLDDLDPKTTFDEQVRAQIQEAIDQLKALIKSQGIQENTDEYRKRLSIGLYCLAATPRSGLISISPLAFEKTTQELEPLGLGAYKEYLKQKGGFLGSGDYETEYSALESIQKEKNKCTEHAKKLFAIFKMAGLDPQFIWVPRKGVAFNNEIEKIIIMREFTLNMDHVCVGLQLSGHMRLFDVGLEQSNAPHQGYVVVSPRQFFAQEKMNLLSRTKSDTERTRLPDEALLLDPFDDRAYVNKGFIEFDKGQVDQAAEDFTRAIDMNTSSFSAYKGRGFARLAKKSFDQSISDLTKALDLEPGWADGYVYRGTAWREKGDPVRAQQDYLLALEKDPRNVEAHVQLSRLWYDKNDLEKANEELNKALEIDPENAFNHLILARNMIALKPSAEAIAQLGSYFKLAKIVENKDATAVQETIRNIQATSAGRWEKTEALKKTAALFSQETNGLDIAIVESHLLCSFGLWIAEYPEAAKDKLSKAVTALIFQKPPSREIKSYLHEILRLMPPQMKSDKDVQKLLSPLLKKI